MHYLAPLFVIVLLSVFPGTRFADAKKGGQKRKKEIDEFNEGRFMPIVPTCTVAGGWARQDSYVNTRKNPLLRREVSIKAADIGEDAVYGEKCDQKLYDSHVKPIYAHDPKLSIYERSDRLLKLIDFLARQFKESNKTSTLRKKICGARTLMACINGECKCPGEDPVTFQEYKYLKPFDLGSFLWHGQVRQMSVCKVDPPGYCNPRGYLQCNSDSVCINLDKVRCSCVYNEEAPPEYQDKDKNAICKTPIRPRPREFQ